MSFLRIHPATVSVLALGLLASACQSTGLRSAVKSAALVQFHADSNVRNPAANDAFPGVRRIVLRAVDNRTRPDAIVQVTDRVSLPPGERTLLFAAESATGRITLSELKIQAEAGIDYVVWPAPGADGEIFAELKRGAYGESLGRSVLWSPPGGGEEASNADAPK
jgi:hypothetical protein